MANSGAKRGYGGKVALWVLGLAIVAIAVGVWMNRTTIEGLGNTGTAYAARVACSCRFVAGRSLESCDTDRMEGMELVSLSDDVEAKSVTATLPLVSSTTATYREGYGCVLEKWEG